MRRLFFLVVFFAGSAWAPPWPALVNRELDEASGLARSLRDPEVLWTLNDSGGRPALYRLGLRGEDYGRVDIPRAMNFDWEELASFAHQGQPALLIGDIGDNEAQRSSVTLYAVSDPGRVGAAKLLWKMDFRYEDGPRDCEAMAVDGKAGHLYLLSKRDRSPVLYRLPLPQKSFESPGETRVAERLGEVTSLPAISDGDLEENPLSAHFLAMPTAMDFAPDLRSVIVVTPKDAHLFRRGAKQSWLDALNGVPTLVDLPPLAQIEAATISADGNHLYVTSEKRPAPLVKLPLPAAIIKPKSHLSTP